MEFTGNNEYASKGVGTAGLTLGIIGTALATLAGGGSLMSRNPRLTTTMLKAAVVDFPALD